MSTAIDRLRALLEQASTDSPDEVSLGRVVVPTHIKVVDGKPVKVKGYTYTRRSAMKRFKAKRARARAQEAAATPRPAAAPEPTMQRAGNVELPPHLSPTKLTSAEEGKAEVAKVKKAFTTAMASLGSGSGIGASEMLSLMASDVWVDYLKSARAKLHSINDLDIPKGQKISVARERGRFETLLRATHLRNRMLKGTITLKDADAELDYLRTRMSTDPSGDKKGTPRYIKVFGPDYPLPIPAMFAALQQQVIKYGINTEAPETTPSAPEVTVTPEDMDQPGYLMAKKLVESLSKPGKSSAITSVTLHKETDSSGWPANWAVVAHTSDGKHSVKYVAADGNAGLWQTDTVKAKELSLYTEVEIPGDTAAPDIDAPEWRTAATAKAKELAAKGQETKLWESGDESFVVTKTSATHTGYAKMTFNADHPKWGLQAVASEASFNAGPLGSGWKQVEIPGDTEAETSGPDVPSAEILAKASTIAASAEKAHPGEVAMYQQGSKVAITVKAASAGVMVRVFSPDTPSGAPWTTDADLQKEVASWTLIPHPGAPKAKTKDEIVAEIGFDPDTAAKTELMAYIKANGGAYVGAMSKAQNAEWVKYHTGLAGDDLANKYGSGSFDDQITHLEAWAKNKTLISKIKAMANKQLKEQEAADDAPHPLVQQSAEAAAAYEAKVSLYAAMPSALAKFDADGVKVGAMVESGKQALGGGDAEWTLFTFSDGGKMSASTVLIGEVLTKATTEEGWVPDVGSTVTNKVAATYASFPSSGTVKDRNQWIKDRGGNYLSQMTDTDKRVWARAHARGDELAKYHVEFEAAAKPGWLHKDHDSHPGSHGSPAGQKARQALADRLIIKSYAGHLFNSDGQWAPDVKSMTSDQHLQMTNDLGLGLVYVGTGAPFVTDDGEVVSKIAAQSLIEQWVMTRPPGMEASPELVKALNANPISVKISKPENVTADAWELSGFFDALPDSANPFASLAPDLDAMTAAEVDGKLKTAAFIGQLGGYDTAKELPLNVKKGALYAVFGGDPDLPPPPEGMFDALKAKIAGGKYVPQFSVEGPATATVTVTPPKAPLTADNYNVNGQAMYLPTGTYVFAMGNGDKAVMYPSGETLVVTPQGTNLFDAPPTDAELEELPIENPPLWVEASTPDLDAPVAQHNGHVIPDGGVLYHGLQGAVLIVHDDGSDYFDASPMHKSGQELHYAANPNSAPQLVPSDGSQQAKAILIEDVQKPGSYVYLPYGGSYAFKPTADAPVVLLSDDAVQPGAIIKVHPKTGTFVIGNGSDPLDGDPTSYTAYTVAGDLIEDADGLPSKYGDAEMMFWDDGVMVAPFKVKKYKDEPKTTMTVGSFEVSYNPDTQKVYLNPNDPDRVILHDTTTGELTPVGPGWTDALLEKFALFSDEDNLTLIESYWSNLSGLDGYTPAAGSSTSSTVMVTLDGKKVPVTAESGQIVATATSAGGAPDSAYVFPAEPDGSPQSYTSMDANGNFEKEFSQVEYTPVEGVDLSVVSVNPVPGSTITVPWGGHSITIEWGLGDDLYAGKPGSPAENLLLHAAAGTGEVISWDKATGEPIAFPQANFDNYQSLLPGGNVQPVTVEGITIEVGPGDKLYTNGVGGVLHLTADGTKGTKHYNYGGLDPKVFDSPMPEAHYLAQGYVPYFAGQSATVDQPSLLPPKEVTYADYVAQSSSILSTKADFEYVTKIESYELSAMPKLIKNYASEDGIESAIASGALHPMVTHAPLSVQAVALYALDESPSITDAINVKAKLGAYGSKQATVEGLPDTFDAYAGTAPDSHKKSAYWSQLNDFIVTGDSTLTTLTQSWDNGGPEAIEAAIADGTLDPNVAEAGLGVKKLAAWSLSKSSEEAPPGGAKPADIYLSMINFKAKNGHFGGTAQPKAPTTPPGPEDFTVPLSKGHTSEQAIYAHWPPEAMAAYAKAKGFDLVASPWNAAAAKEIAAHLAGTHPSQVPVAVEPKPVPKKDPVLSSIPKLFGGGSHTINFWKDEDGNKWLSKPHPNDPNSRLRAEAEDAGNRAGVLYGFNSPATYAMQLNGQWSYVQEIKDADSTFAGVNPDDLTEQQLIDAMSEHVLDWMISNHDTHVENLMIEPDGKVFGIDKGQAWKFFGSDTLAVGYQPSGNPKPVWYDRFYQQLQSGKVDKARADKVTAAVLARARSMSTTHAEEFEALIDKALSHRKDFGKFGTKAKFKQAMIARRLGLEDDFAKLYGELYAKGGYGALPSPTPPVVSRSFTINGKSIERQFFSGLSAEALASVEKSAVHGQSLFFAGTDLEDAHVLAYETKVGGQRTLNMHTKVRKDADAQVAQWLNAQTIATSSATATSTTFTPVDKSVQLYGSDTWHSALVAAAKTVNTHAGDGAYNTSTIAAFNSARDTMTALQDAVQAHAKANPMTPYSAGELQFVTLQQQQKWLAMVDNYTAIANEIGGAYATQTKTPSKSYAMWTDFPSPKAKVSETYSGAGKDMKIELLEDGTYLQFTKGSEAGSVLTEAAAKGLIKDFKLSSSDDVVDLGTVGAKALKLFKKPTQHDSGSYDPATGELSVNAGTTSGATGTAIEIQYGDDVVIQYLPWSEGAKAHKGTLRVRVNGYDGSMEKAQEALDVLKQMGLDLDPADDDDMELFYWRHLEGVARDRKTDGVKIGKALTALSQIPKGLSVKEEIEKRRAAWALYMGKSAVDKAVAEGRYLPRFSRYRLQNGADGDPAGHPYWIRADADLKATVAALGTNSPYLQHSLSGSIVQLAKSGALISTDDRTRMLGQFITGMSSSSDMGHGSSGFIFTRLHNALKGSSSILMRPETMMRTSTYSFTGDNFGEINNRKNSSPFDPKVAAKFSGGGNETMIKHGASVLDDIEIIQTGTAAQRQEIIDFLLALGITEIRGVPVAERVVYGTAALKAALKKFSQEIQDTMDDLIAALSAEVVLP